LLVLKNLNNWQTCGPILSVQTQGALLVSHKNFAEISHKVNRPNENRAAKYIRSSPVTSIEAADPALSGLSGGYV
jgi:hypothetical protein